MIPEDSQTMAPAQVDGPHGKKLKLISRKALMSTAIAVAGVAVLSGGVLAATNGHKGGPSDEVVDKVAEILEIDSDELGEALALARTELSQEKRDARLDQLVEDGVLTPGQVDEIKAWQANRPAILDEIGPSGHHRRGNGPVSDERLAQLVEDGTLTQEQADEITAWHDARPDALAEIKPERGAQNRHQRRGHGFKGQFRGSFEGKFEGEFRGRFPGGSGGPGSFGQLFGDRFNLEIPGVESNIELIIPPTDGRSA